MVNQDLNIELLELLPPWYREILDYQEICQSEQEQFDLLAAEIQAVSNNFFFQTMGFDGVEMWEQIFHIKPNPVAEDLEFRRFRVLTRISSRAPFTMNFLRTKLDQIIGPGNWTMRMDYPNYTLYVESGAKNQMYATELLINIGRIKPAHIAFVNTTLIQSELILTEEISQAQSQWNYRLGTWALFSAPFISTSSEEVIKVPQTPSIQERLLSDVAGFVSDDVAAARVNGTVIINAINKSTDGTILTITYDVLPNQASEISKLELLDASGNVLTSTDVYTHVGNDGVQLKHTIPVKEGTQ